jgi:hypothetical protein
MPVVLDWKAIDPDGKELSREAFIGTGNLPPGRVRAMNVATNHPGAKNVGVSCRPELDEEIHVFTRRSMGVTFGGAPSGQVAEVVVLEIRNADRVRLYLRPDGTVILSSEEING